MQPQAHRIEIFKDISIVNRLKECSRIQSPSNFLGHDLFSIWIAIEQFFDHDIQSTNYLEVMVWQRIRSVLQSLMRILHNSRPRIRTRSITSVPITVKNSFSRTRRDIRALTPTSALSPAMRRAERGVKGKKIFSS